MRITIEIDTDNAAFEDGKRREVVHILREVVADIGAGETEGSVRDINGNTVCRWEANNT